MNETRALAEFVARIKYTDIPKSVREHAKLCILDWLGASLAGSTEPSAKIVYSIIKELGGRRESTIIGGNAKSSCVNAALANGMLGHTVEMDDVHELSIVHPAAPVVPAALAVGERCGSYGRDIVTAVILGYEAEIRLGIAMNPSHYKYWHNTGTCGTFGAAVASSKLLHLGEEEVIQALGIAGNQAAGLVENFGTMSKFLSPGKAAHSGILAALLAEKGFTSSKQILESEGGYCYAASTEPKLSRITDGLGARFEIMRTCFKRHASCAHTHGAIDAVQSLAAKYDLDPGHVEEIVVETYPIATKVVGHKPAPKTGSDAKFSLHYCLAAALIFGSVGLEQFREEKLDDPKLHELSGKVIVRTADEFANALLGPARVTIRLRDGGERSCTVNVPKGYPDNALTAEELKQKFRKLAGLALPKPQVDRIISKVENLDRIETSSLTSLL